MRKMVSLFLVFILSISLCTPAFATEIPETEATGAILITVDTQEEYEAVVAEIEEHNQRSAQLWQQALTDSGTPVMETTGLQSEVMPLSSYEVVSEYYTDYVGFFTPAYITFSATFTTTTNTYGSTIIDQVRNITAYGRSNGTTVTVNDYLYTIIDSGRTIATNYSCVVGVKVADAENYSYYSREYYVEFYATGGANVYD